VLFDIETKRSAEEVGGWSHVHRLGVALAVSCFMEENSFRVYREADVNALVDDLRSADVVVGFNSVRFDYQVLSGYTGEDFERSLPTLDLLEEVEQAAGFRLGLSALCQATLGSEKSGDGLQSLAWFREGRFEEIEQYCRRDVELLRDLYLFGRREGYVCYHDAEGRLLQLPVRWP
jgi:DEAD/DEAH box helicase domain-containing protein